MIVLGEGQINGLLLPGLHADHLLLEAGNEGVGAQRQLIALGRAALEGHAVLDALIVHDHAVAHLGGPVHRLQLGGAVHILLELIVHRRVGDGGKNLVGLQALILLQGDHGTDSDNGLKGEALFPQIGDFHPGRGNGIQALLLNGLHACLGIDLLNGIFIEYSSAVHPLNDLTGGLALPEPGDRDAAAVLAIGFVQAGFELFLTHFNGQFDLKLLFVFYNALDIHVLFPPVKRPFCSLESLKRHCIAVYIGYIIRFFPELPDFFSSFQDFFRAKL